MNIQIKYFGMLSELTGCDQEMISIDPMKIGELLKLLYKKYNSLENKDFQIAQDQIIVSKDTVLSGAEIALLPPFSGG